MYNQNTMSSTTKFQSKKISIKLTDRNSDVNYEYKGFNNDKNNNQTYFFKVPKIKINT